MRAVSVVFSRNSRTRKSLKLFRKSGRKRGQVNGLLKRFLAS